MNYENPPGPPPPVVQQLSGTQRATLYAHITASFGRALRTGVPQWYAEEGRGLVIILVGSTQFDRLSPPMYLSLDHWQRTPQFMIAPCEHLVRAIETYNPECEHLLLAISGRRPFVRRYTWWLMSFHRRGVRRQARNPM